MRNIFATRRNRALRTLREIDKADHKRGFVVRDIPDFEQGTVEHTIVVLEKGEEGESKIGPTRIRHSHELNEGRIGKLISGEFFHV